MIHANPRPVSTAGAARTDPRLWERGYHRVSVRAATVRERRGMHSHDNNAFEACVNADNQIPIEEVIKWQPTEAPVADF